MTMRAKRKAPAVKRGARVRLGTCETGDVVQVDNLQCAVVHQMRLGGKVWVRYCDEVSFREISEPAFLSADLEVQIIRRGVERYASMGGGGEVDPVRRKS